MKLGRHVAAAVLISFSIAACSLASDKTIAETAVDRFHDQLNAGAFREIYAAASEQFREATSEAELTELLAAVQRKLGKVEGSEQTSFNVTTTPTITAVNLTYHTRFTQATATETFSWAIREGKAILVGYRIDSAALVVR